jgi:hypothetical protein
MSRVRASEICKTCGKPGVRYTSGAWCCKPCKFARAAEIVRLRAAGKVLAVLDRADSEESVIEQAGDIGINAAECRLEHVKHIGAVLWDERQVERQRWAIKAQQARREARA